MFLVLDWKLCIANETCHTVVFYLLSLYVYSYTYSEYKNRLSYKHNHAYINILVLILNKYNMYHDEMYICTVASYIHTLQQH